MTDTCAIYLRRSREKRDGSTLGLEAQRERCEAYAKAKGWNVYGVYADDDVSGSIAPESRPACKRMLEAPRGSFSVVLVLTQDRWSRDNLHIEDVIRSFGRRGLRLETVETPLHLETVTGRAQSRMKAVFDQQYREYVSEKTREALAALKAKGVKLGTVPLESRSPEGAQAAARALQLRESGATLRMIADALNAEGFRTARGAHFLDMTVLRVLRRQAA